MCLNEIEKLINTYLTQLEILKNYEKYYAGESSTFELRFTRGQISMLKNIICDLKGII